MYDLGYKYGIYGSDVLTLSLIINYFTMISITFASIDWLNNKYDQIILADLINIKKII
jgi:predicted hydrocarbon binding protein